VVSHDTGNKVIDGAAKNVAPESKIQMISSRSGKITGLQNKILLTLQKY
jgi:hypothetical protein